MRIAARSRANLFPGARRKEHRSPRVALGRRKAREAARKGKKLGASRPRTERCPNLGGKTQNSRRNRNFPHIFARTRLFFTRIYR